jgi:DNA-binding NarL/FixJ family response regulator
LAAPRRSREPEGKGDGALTPEVSLSPREWDIFRELSRGATNREIAERLGVSVHTVKSHVKLILLKLNASNRTAAAADCSRGASRMVFLMTSLRTIDRRLNRHKH